MNFLFILYKKCELILALLYLFVIFFYIINSGLIKLSDDNYIQLAELVQSLESYSFVNLRIYLLQPKLNKFLVKSLYGILLMLPQGKAYQALYKRLSHMNMIYRLDFEFHNKHNKNISCETKNTRVEEEEVQYYLKIFEKIHMRKKLKQITSLNSDNMLCDYQNDEDYEDNVDNCAYEVIYDNSGDLKL